MKRFISLSRIQPRSQEEFRQPLNREAALGTPCDTCCAGLGASWVFFAGLAQVGTESWATTT